MAETKFKETEIGLIPEGWECVRFGDIIDFLPNNTLSRECLSNEGTVKNIHYGDVLINYGNVLDVSSPTIPCIDNKKLGSYKPGRIAQDGDIIIADTAEDETVCKATELWNVGQNKVVSGLHTMWCRPKKGLFASKYLGCFVNSSIYHNQVLPFIQGIKVSSVSKKDIKETWLLVPPIVEQKRIAVALSSVDELLASLDKQIAKTRDIRQGAMQQLLTGAKRLKGFSGQWTSKKLGDHADIYRGGSPRPIESFITDDINGINWIKIGDVDPVAKYIRSTAEKIKPSGVSSTRLVHKGDLILSNSMSFGRPYILELDGAIHDGWLVIQNYQKTFNTDFLYYALSSDAVMAQYKASAAGSSVQNLNKDKVADVVIYAPDSLDEQKHIADVLTSLDDTIEGLEAKRQKYESIKAGMMQQLLTGTTTCNVNP